MTIPSAGPWISDKEVSYVTDACLNGWYDRWHEYLDRFEQSLASYIGVRYVLPTSSCTGALHLIMKAIGIKSGDEVIVPNNTWIGTVTGIVYCGGLPQFVDVEPDSWCISPYCIEKAITSKTKAIVAVHMYGHPCEMNKLKELANHYNLTLVEDAAPGIGSRYFDRPMGQWGDISAFSFQGAKPLVMGEGGAIVTNNQELYEKVCYYNDHARDLKKTLFNTDIGYKYKLSNLQAALGTAQIERAQEIVNKRREIFFHYKKRLQDVSFITLNTERPNCFNNYYIPSLVVQPGSPICRDEIMARLTELKIGHRPFFHCLSTMPMFSARETPVAYYLSQNGLNLPCPSTITDEQINFVCDHLRKWFKCG